MSEERRPEMLPEEQAGQEENSPSAPGKLRRAFALLSVFFGAVTIVALAIGGILFARIRAGAAQEAEGEAVYTKAQIDRFITSVLITVQNDGIADSSGVPADMVFIASFNALEQRLSVIALSRDLLLAEGETLGALYAAGGPGQLINALNDTFALDLQSYVATDTHFLASVIDLLGGIPAELGEEEAAYIAAAMGREQAAGAVRLDGAASMIHAMDNVSEEARLGGLDRSLALVLATVSELRSTAVKEEMLSLLSLVLSSVRTNLGMDDLQALGYEILRADEIELRSLALPAPDTWEEAEGMQIEADLEAVGSALRSALYG